MKTLEKNQDKIQQICDVLRKDTLEPAQEKAKEIIDEANKRAEGIVADAKKEAQEYLLEARKVIEQERNVFNSSLAQAGKQAVEALKQTITKELFQTELVKIVNQESADIAIVEKLVHALVSAMEKEGLGADLNVYIPKSLSPEDVNKKLLADVIKNIKGRAVTVGNFQGGVKVKVDNKDLTIDISDTALVDLLTTYLKKPEFREMIFKVV